MRRIPGDALFVALQSSVKKIELSFPYSTNILWRYGNERVKFKGNLAILNSFTD